MSGKRSLCALICIFALSVSGCFRIPDRVWKNPNVANILRFSEVMLGDGIIEELHDNNVVSGVKWQKLKLSENSKKRFPKLSEAFDKYNEARLTEATAQMTEFIPKINEVSGDESDPIYFTSETALYTQRADNRIMSFLEKTYTDYGGVHPETFWKAKNFDPDTGYEVRLSDVVTDPDGFSAILEKKLCEKYADFDPEVLKDRLNIYKPEELTWTIDYQGLTFWLDPYGTVPFTDKTSPLKIWFDEYPDMFNEKYTSELLSIYAVSLPIGVEVPFDSVADDDIRDSVLVRTDYDRYASYKMLSVSVNGTTYTDEINYGYGFDVYLVFMNGKNYIYYDLNSDNDYHKVCGLDINGSEIRQITDLSGTGFYSEYSEEDEPTRITEYKYVFNDPFDFKFKSRFDILGTRSGYASFAISGEDGTPVMKDKAFNIESEYGITTIRPIDATRLSDGEQEAVPSGTTLYPLRTDGNSYIDMKTDKGTELRLEIDISSWPRTVNGVPEDECFESLPYAG